VPLGADGDTDLFDGEGVTGMHAVERILYSDGIPSTVVTFESMLPGYRAAAFPATADEAADMKTGLLQRLIDDVTELQAQWPPANVDITAAYQGLIDLMDEQREKVTKAATGEEESRYAQMTLFDLRNNLDGTKTISLLFKPWLRAQSGGDAVDTSIEQGMADLATVYAGFSGDEIPQPPDGWSSDHPTEEQLATPFG